MYDNFGELLEYCTQHECPISEAVLRNETKLTGQSREQVLAGLRDMFEVMRASAARALDAPLKAGFSLISGVAHRQSTYAARTDTLCGNMINKLMARALSSSETTGLPAFLAKSSSFITFFAPATLTAPPFTA